MMAMVRASGVIELRSQDAHQPDVMELAPLEHRVGLDALVAEPGVAKKAWAASLKPNTCT